MFTESVLKATKEVAANFISGKVIFLTESDFKTALSSSLTANLEANMTVNTESPWYDTYTTNSTYYIDITAYITDKLQITYDPTLNRKGYKYEDEALAVELKYFRYVSDIQGIADDFHKVSLLIKNPKNECFIVAAARTNEIFNLSKTFINNQFEYYRVEYNSKVKIILIGPNEMIELI
jgi:hypothetical protein